MRIRIAIALLTAVSFLCSNQGAQADFSVGATNKVSFNFSGGISNGVALNPRQPANGGYLVYQSGASDVVPNDTNSSDDIFFRSATSSAIMAASINELGQLGDSRSQNPSVSSVAADGLFAIAFNTAASNLNTLFPDENDFDDIYLRLPTLGKTLQVSFSRNLADLTVEPADGDSVSPSIALQEDTKTFFVAFASDATNIRLDDNNLHRDIFIASVDIPSFLSTGDPGVATSFEAIDGGAGLPQPNGDSDQPSISGNTRYVAFSSFATNLTSGGVSSSSRQIYLFDRTTKTNVLISKSVSGLPGDDDSQKPSISFNGRFITYLTRATNIVAGNPDNNAVVVRYDTVTGLTSRVDVTQAGVAANRSSIDCNINSNGRFVTFSSFATNLSSNDASEISNVYVKDIETGTLTRITKSFTGLEPNGSSAAGSISGKKYNSLDGVLSFLSDANNLVPGDTFNQDIFTTGVSVSPPVLARGISIEVPPDVVVSGGGKKKNITLDLQQFGLPSPQSLVQGGVSSGSQEFDVSDARKPKDKVVYDVRIESTSGRKRDNLQKIAKRNQVAFRKVKPGSYTARYRVMVMRGDKVRSKTPFSPRRPFKA